MKASKKATSMAIAAVLSGVVFATTAFAASNNVTGYEKCKESMFTLYTAKNFTLNGSYSLNLDGEEISSAKMFYAKEDENNERTEMTNVIGNEVIENVSSNNNGIYISKQPYSDEYYRYDNSEWFSSYPESERSLSDNEKRLFSILMDMFAGDARNYFISNGGNISVSLERNQVPEFFQAALSVVSEKMTSEYYNDDYEDDSYYHNQRGILDSKMRKVVSDMYIKSIYANGRLDENDMLNDAQMTLTISGKDKDGIPHDLTLTVAYSIKDLGTTKAEPIDLTGKKVNEPSISYKPYAQPDAVETYEDADWADEDFDY